MCEITNNLSKIKVGYKVVAVRNGKIYSIFTGQEYKVGPVPQPPEVQIPLTGAFRQSFDFVAEPYYKPALVGKTAVFYRKETASIYKKNRETYGDWDIDYKIKIAKISFSGDVYKGQIDFSWSRAASKLIAGSVIKSIEIVD